MYFIGSTRAGNSLIGVLSESLIFGERPERIAHDRSFLVSDLRDLLTSLIFGEQPEQFAHSRSFDLSEMSK